MQLIPFNIKVTPPKAVPVQFFGLFPHVCDAVIAAAEQFGLESKISARPLPRLPVGKLVQQ